MGATTRMGYYSQQQTETLSLGGTVLGEMRRLSDPHTTEEELMSVLGKDETIKRIEKAVEKLNGAING